MMVSEKINDSASSVNASEFVSFAGDDVRLAGQIDYPNEREPRDGYPLIFVIQHATSTSRHEYDHITKLGSDIGAAVFRWDKRGTGGSGSGGGGSVTVDTLRAYEIALTQASIDTSHVIIYAQNEGTVLLGEAFDKFKDIQVPKGVVLAGNMLDEAAILAIDVPVHIVISKNDWNDWRLYGEAASEAHAEEHGYTASFYVAMNTDRRLMYHSGNTFHKGTESSVKHWLKHTCQIS